MKKLRENNRRGPSETGNRNSLREDGSCYFKDYYEPDEDHQEIPIENYVADIYKDGEIIEIQTRQFNRMRGKLQAFLPLYPVTIIYPIPYENG